MSLRLGIFFIRAATVAGLGNSIFPVPPKNFTRSFGMSTITSSWDSILSFSHPSCYPASPESLLRSWTHQCPQRHQRSDWNILVIHQLFLRERQRFHNGSCLVLALRVDQEDDAFAIAGRIPLADFPVEVELHSCPNL